MLQDVDVGRRSISAYEGIAPSVTLESLREAAEALQGARILHLNATPYGGGVSELLRSVVPLLNDLGLVADWKVIYGDDDFFDVTKTIHNALQSADKGLDTTQQDIYLKNTQKNAARLEEVYDFIFVHDPQPVAIPTMRGTGNARWIWRCHIDTSAPHPDVWAFLRSYLDPYDAAVFTMEEFVPPDLPVQQVEMIPPAIDPLSPKNFDLPEDMAHQVLGWIGLRLGRPLITQVARFDPWKDPLGVIEAYRMAREEVSDAQLALVGSMALDDPEGWSIYEKVKAECETDPLMHVFTNLTGVGNIEVNAFQRLSDIVVQKSIREGFGLVVSEALWKETPVVAGRAGGIPLQMADGTGGRLVEDVEDCAAALVELLTHPERANAAGRKGQERIRQHFLLPRLLLNHLTLMQDVLGTERALERDPTWAEDRDPVCGMALGDPESAWSTAWNGKRYVFCSQHCQRQFQERPEHYLQAFERSSSGTGQP
jgi:trehalose synthase